MSEIHFPAAEVVRVPQVGERRARQERRPAPGRQLPRDEAREGETAVEASDAPPPDTATNMAQGNIDVLT